MEHRVRIAGAAGQGVQTTADLLGKAVTRSGLHVICTSDAESRIRGGLNFSHLRICTDRHAGVTDDFDILVAVSPQAQQAFADWLPEDGALICQDECQHPGLVPVRLSELARQAGNARAAGTVGLSAVCALLGIELEIVTGVVKERFLSNEKLLGVNIRAAELGYRESQAFKPGERFRLPGGEPGEKRLWMAGHEALSLGALAGGVSFVAGYPMSPATSILTDLAGWAEQAGVLVEQAEDEIAAINMVAGASYTGARAMTATSGGGFCLMTEGVSLLGMIEAPAVIMLGQRPGPSTGLPTRTAQGDLHLVLHAGQGFFPRVILAPRNIPDCFEIGARAFDIAERYQVPVFVLTDQLLQDSQESIKPFDPGGLPDTRHLVAAGKGYQRYARTEDGISPFAAPGASDQVVVVDSDEHDEDGHLTESAERLRKNETVSAASLLPAPVVEGDPAGQPLVVSWGSTFETIREARKTCDFAHLHLRQLWPLPEEHLAPLKTASSIAVVENNVGGELFTLLKRFAGRSIDHQVNRLDGRPFDVAGLADRLREVL
jgi:2-oxoglutarate ferredoxin oxidoreductase subunit alpha